ncbi:alpha-2-macroglobulin family protein [Hymenobacter busanensis]|uniref:Alpha-2-macroglobulin family protein n=1 Tax=Hymenobacter busanensis TaxID=2607656 RepID=A0A7L4ZWV1_9BACT|nr:MG2 domain-containing protein [Hymenobacter busanensis]KAA9332164.1 alpha-2-macroglobulin family protein [Hymenobacter busanensis]QHJ07497.1 alpha-2-macroglobulin family protein [Hymenobacter busanensis]
MTSPQVLRLPLLVLLALLCACSKPGADDASADGEEIDPYENLVFSFDEPVAAAEQTSRWDTTQYVRFEPAVRGKFMWTSDRELVFSPAHPFSPSTAFKAEWRPQALPKEAQRKLPELKRRRFHTPYLDMTIPQVFWTAGSNGPAVRLNVGFNYPVRPADVGQHLLLTANGQQVPFEVVSAQADKVVGVQPTQAIAAGSAIQLVLSPGLMPVGAPAQADTTNRRRLSGSVTVPDPQELQVREVSGTQIEGEPAVTILTNQPVDAAALQPLIAVQPAVGYTVEAKESGLVLRGGFELGKSYTVSIQAGATGELGGRLNQAVSQQVSFSDERPSISFAHGDKAMYLGAAGLRNLGLRLNEVNRVKVSIYKVYANNIRELLRSGEQYGYDEEEGGGEEEGGEYVDHSYNYYNTADYGNLLTERTYTTAGLPKQGSLRLLHLSLQDLEFSNQLKGLYVIRVQDTERQWLQVSKLVTVSDLGVVVKQGQTGALVFVNSLRTAKPVGGATVRFISTNNQTMFTGATNASGVAQMGTNADTALARRFQLETVLVQSGQDFTFLSLPRSRVETSRYDVGGLQSNAARFQAFLYGDRDLYRPGDTIRTNTVVRTDDWRVPAGAVPMKIRLLLPSGKEYASYRRTLTKDGSFEAPFILPASVMTGLYTLEVLTGNDVLLTSKQISVEEFVPDRLKVTVTAAPTVVKPGQTVRAAVLAQNLFGPPATDRKVEVEFSLKQKTFAPKDYPDYSFSLESGGTQRRYSDGTESESSLNSRFEKAVREGQTDAQGRATVEYPVPDYRDLGTLEGTAFGTVFDETGRPVNRLATFEVRTQQVMYGVQQLPELVSTRQPTNIRVVALNPQNSTQGKPANAAALVRVVRILWETVLERQGGRFIYQSQRREEVVLTKTVQAAPVGTATFQPVYSGEYEVRVARPGAETYVASRFYAYGYGDTPSNAFEVSNEGQVQIEPDKASYHPGETATLLLKTPFPGRVLVTVERNRVFDHFYVDTDQKSARVTVPIRAGHVPNVYVTATAIRPMSTDTRNPLTVARGFVPLTVEKPEAKLPVAIKAPAQSRSQTYQLVEVQTKPGAAVTLAVVDEGILQMKDYRTPDPFGYFYQKRALEVSAHDVYPFLLPELGTSSTGGDGYDLSRRTTPVPSRRVQLVARWSGVQHADASGKVRVKVRIPQFSGALRLMALAYKGDAFGSDDHTMRVADPVVISTALPRFLSPGDTIDVPVTLTNTTEKEIIVTASQRTTGLLESVYQHHANPPVKIETVQFCQLLPNSEKRIVFHAYAKNAVGNGSITIAAKPSKGTNETFTETIELPIRPASPLQMRTGAGVVQGGKTQPLDLRTDFLPTSQRSQLVLSRSPMTEFSKDLRYLLQYPYGCLEQTVSAAFPQLYYPDLAVALGQTKKQQRYNPNYHVQEAIRKIEAQQLYNGSLSYWPGGDYDNWWTSAYAAHFLLEAKRAGFAVNASVLDKVLRYLQYRIRKRETEEYQYLTAGSVAHQKTIAKKEIPYSLYVLALAGRPDPVALNYYQANQGLLSQDSKFVLASTSALSGQTKGFRALLPRSFSETAARRALDGSFYSPVRDLGLALNTLIEADPQNPQVAQMARQLSRLVKQAGWLSTQERAFALLALGKVAHNTRNSTVTATLAEASGAVLGQYKGPQNLNVSNVANRRLSLKTQGSGPLYYFWTLEGISPTGQVREEDQQLQVRRQFLDRTGQPFGLTQGRAEFRQNDLVVVKITLQSSDVAGDVPNVAITDLLPAGLEIENPRIGAVRELTWATDAATPDYLDVRDDRINLFTTATPKPKSFYYLARAVSKGTFKLGPVSSDAMYNAEYHSYAGAGVVRVR